MDDYTLVIPTYKRPVMLRSALTHLAGYEKTIRVLVLDSSPEPEAAANRATVREFPHVQHRVYDPATPFATKLLSGLREVTTPFISLSADDDLLFPAAVEKCLKQMRQRSELAAAHGIYLSFEFSEAPPHTLQLGCEYDSPSNDDPSAAKRLLRLLSRYEALYYAVYRTPVMREIFEIQARIESLHYQELFQAVATVLHGPILRIPDIYCARRVSPPADGQRKRCEPVFWILEDDYMDFFSAYLAYRVLVLDWWRAREPKLDMAQMARVCDSAHYLYLRRAFQPHFPHLRRILRPDIILETLGQSLGIDLQFIRREYCKHERQQETNSRQSRGFNIAGRAASLANTTLQWAGSRLGGKDGLSFPCDDRPVVYGPTLTRQKRPDGLLDAARTLREYVQRELEFSRKLSPPSPALR